MATIGSDIDFAAQCLREGKLVAIPTETVYGLAANALDEKAVVRIFEAKNRPFFDPLIVHVHTIGAMNAFAKDIPPLALRLAETFWPGPLTLLLPKNNIIPDLVTAGSELVGIRVPDNSFTTNLLRALDFPLAAPSANPFGYISPTSALHVQAQLGEKVEYILDGGECRVGLESTIVGFVNYEPVIMRLGGIAVHEIEKICGPVHIQLNQSSNPSAPGQLKSHYAPHKPFLVGDIGKLLHENSSQKAGVISFTKRYPVKEAMKNWVLAPTGSMQEAAKNLFRVMREADTSEADCIIAEYVPEEGLGSAINDRLKRAANPNH